MIAATAAAATVGAVLVIGPSGAAAAGPGYALAASDSRCSPGSRSAASGCPPGSQGQAGNGPGQNGLGSGYQPGVRVTRKVGQAGTVTVTRTVARLAARALGPARRRDSFEIADSVLEG